MKRKAVDKNTMLQTVDESAAFNCNDDTTAAVDTPGNLDGTGTADDSTGERIKSKDVQALVGLVQDNLCGCLWQK